MGTSCVAMGGVLAVMGCTDAVKSCIRQGRRMNAYALKREMNALVPKRELKAVAPKRRAVDAGQVMACLGTGACGAAVGIACGLIGEFTLETSCIAMGGVLAVMGCTDAVKSCIRQGRRMNELAPKREMTAIAVKR